MLPGSLGRVCSRPCEDNCRHGWPGNGEPKTGALVNIGMTALVYWLLAPFFAELVAYTVSLIVARARGGGATKLSWGYGWFAVAGLINGLSVYSLNTEE